MTTIDLDAYLRRIAYVGPRQPTLAVLAAICRAHPAAIAFENIDPLLGRAPSLALEALQTKLVGRRRGGYCYEHNALLREALRGLGMQVTALAARVVWMQPKPAPVRPRSHMLLLVELPGESTSAARGPFIADAGFGGHLLAAPLRFIAGLAQRTPGGHERVTHDGEVFTLEAELQGSWAPLYRFTLEPQLPADYEPLNWFTATHPGSIFVHNLRLERLTPQRRAGLLNDRLTLRTPGGEPPEVRRIQSAAELGRVLDQVFDIDSPVPIDELFGRMPKGLDGALLPNPPPR